jgi:hypothetical protein
LLSQSRIECRLRPAQQQRMSAEADATGTNRDQTNETLAPFRFMKGRNVVATSSAAKQNEPGHARLEIESDCQFPSLCHQAAAESPR